MQDQFFVSSRWLSAISSSHFLGFHGRYDNRQLRSMFSIKPELYLRGVVCVHSGPSNRPHYKEETVAAIGCGLLHFSKHFLLISNRICIVLSVWLVSIG